METYEEVENIIFYISKALLFLGNKVVAKLVRAFGLSCLSIARPLDFWCFEDSPFEGSPKLLSTLPFLP